MAVPLEYVIERVGDEVSIEKSHDGLLTLFDALELADRLISAANQQNIALEPKLQEIALKLK